MLQGGPHPLQSKVPLKDTCTNNKGPKQFSRVSNTCSMKMTNHQAGFPQWNSFEIYYSNKIVCCFHYFIEIQFCLHQHSGCLVQLISRNARQ